MDLKLNNTILHFNKIVYVDASKGKDSSKAGSINQPFKSMKSSMNYLCSCESFKSNCAIILKKGTYDITDFINDNSNNMNISLIAFPGDQGKVLINSNNYLKNKGLNKRNSYKINMHFYGLVFKEVSNFFFNLGNDENVVEYYNCVFSTLTVGKWTNSLIKNCIFDNCIGDKNNTSIKGKCINSADNNDFLKCFDGPKTKLFNNVSIDKKFSIVEKTPDYEGVGVYGGDFTWPLSKAASKASIKKSAVPLRNKKNSKKSNSLKEASKAVIKEKVKDIKSAVPTSSTAETKIVSKAKEIKKYEFKINEVSLQVNKFVYVDSINGSDKGEFGDLYLPFKTVKKAMDYLNKEDFKDDCAIIFKEGTYDIKDILNDKTYTLKDEYKDMNVRWVAVPGIQGKIFIESSNGNFKPSSSMKFYGLVFRDINEEGMSLNDSEYYNCIFDNVSINEEENDLEHKLQNCVFDTCEYDNARVYEGDFAWSDPIHAPNEFRINDESLWFDKFVYVDSTHGYDANNGEFSSPFKTVKKAMDYLNGNPRYRTYCAVIFKNGSYDISNCLDKESGKFSSEYNGMNVSFISDLYVQGKVFINSSIGFNAYSDNLMRFKFYNLVFKDIDGKGMNLDGEYYNCVFDNIKINEENNKDSFAFLMNCGLINTAEHGSINGKCINCVSTNDSIKCIDGEKISVEYNVLFDDYYNVISNIKEHDGVGYNPDKTFANLGVYGGNFAWKLPDYSKCEFKINNTCLNFTKFVYVDPNNGDDNNKGTYSSSFKTIKKAMDSLNINRIEKSNCAVILKEGTYDISDILVEEGNSVKDDYASMHVNFIADIGLQGRVFIRSKKGFTPGINSLQSIKMNFYRIVFKEIEEGMILNSDNEINHYYNCVFDNIKLGGNDKGVIMYNCTFFNTADMNNGHKSYGKCINCITTNDHVEPLNGEMLSVLFNAWIEPGRYNITSNGWIGTGIGENADRSNASLGIYGGEFQWN